MRPSERESAGNEERAVAIGSDPDRTWLFRVGGISALLLGLGYIATIPLYAVVGIPPDSGAEWLSYGADKTTMWWGILALQVFTDFLFVPVALALYLALRAVDKNLTLLAAAFLILFVVLDLAVTWPNYAAFISLSSDYAAATTDAERAALVAAAEYASAVTTSTLEGVYSIVVPSIGILLFGIVMLRSSFGRTAGYVGILTAVLGIASVVVPPIVPALGPTIILASILTTVWVLLVGYRLIRQDFQAHPV